MAGQISDDKGRDRKETRAFPTSGYGQKENASPISVKEKSKYMQCSAPFIFVYKTQHSVISLSNCFWSTLVCENGT